jgi:hypothetical protein
VNFPRVPQNRSVSTHIADQVCRMLIHVVQTVKKKPKQVSGHKESHQYGSD